MSNVSIYLNFMGNAEEAFNLYKKVFGTEFLTPPMRMKDMTPREGAPTIAEADRLYKGLSAGGTDEVAPHDEFWGYWGTCKDRFGIRWMFNVMKQ